MSDRAVISADGRYRYALTRDTGQLGAEGTVLFVMLNPSTADANVDDPTIRRCLAFARRWGYAGLTVGNLFALRATDPSELARAADPIGPNDDEWLDRLAARATEIIAAWGAHKLAVSRARDVLPRLEHYCGTASCIGQTRALAPRHPLFVRADAPRRPLQRYAEAMP
jgi:hypothetical protein